jgi:hypothetical protein
MDGVNFIPKTKDQMASRAIKPESPQKKLILFALAIIVAAAMMVGGIYYYVYGYLESEVSILEQQNEDIKAQYESILPVELEVGEFLASIEEVLEYDVQLANTFADLQPYFLSSLSMASISYQSATQVINIQASIDNFDLSNQQVSRLRESSVVRSAEIVGQQATNSQTGRVEFTMEIRLQ